jgi:hypothetical protein
MPSDSLKREEIEGTMTVSAEGLSCFGKDAVEGILLAEALYLRH